MMLIMIQNSDIEAKSYRDPMKRHSYSLRLIDPKFHVNKLNDLLVLYQM